MPYSVIKDLNESLSEIVLRKGRSCEFSFDEGGLDKSAHHRLYLTAEDRMSSIFKEEQFGDKLYQLIEDSLNSEKAELDRYCLDMSEKKPRPFLKCAVIKRVWNGSPTDGNYGIGKAINNKWELSIFAKAENLKTEEGGFLRFRLETWDKKPGVDPHITINEPDHRYFVDIPEGTYEYTKFSKDIEIDFKNTATVVLYVEGENYSGNIYLERPALTASNGVNVVPCFDVAVPCKNERYSEHNWLGMNLAKKEWPIFRMEINGKVFFEDETFLRIHRYSPVEIQIPDDYIEDQNTIKITYLSDYRDTVPVAIKEVKILEKPKAPFHIHYLPECAVMGKDIALLIETEKDGMSFDIKSELLSLAREYTFDKAGLHVINLACKEYTNDMEFTLVSGDYCVTEAIRRSIVRPEDSVTVGSGDLVYVDNSDLQAVCDYIEWAVAGKTHNLITIRPAYRWGGQRTVNPAVWKKLCEICNGMGISYVHMTDGRDLPGYCANPSPDMLEGERFLGVQQHERDGAAFYWGYKSQVLYPIADSWFDLKMRLYREKPYNVDYFSGGHTRSFDSNSGYYFTRYVDCRPDMKEAHTGAIRTLKNIKAFDTRHTGPSVMFKYFYEAGWDWTGAETMDSSTETLLAFMRGAAKAYKKDKTGVHHAVQWSTRPHDTQERYRRFLLANYVSYMQGVTDINTEEGLWFLECQYSSHNRFSDACVSHADMQRKLVDFARTHSRTGRYYTPVAYVHGRYDGWYGFGSSRNLFGMENLKRAEPENSWELMKIFYPQNVINGGGVTGYYPEGHGKPIGLVSGTPRGNVDVLPIENGDFSEYRLAVFTSYNCAEKGDMDRMLDFASKGGTILAAIPHFSDVTYRPDIIANKVNIISCDLTDMIFDGQPKFIDGHCINLTKNAKVLEETEKGFPLVAEIPIGEGKLVLLNKCVYPANPDVKPVYEKLIIKLSDKAHENDIANIICGEDVQFTRYMQDDGSMHIYLTPVDWYNSPESDRYATLRVGADLYDLKLRFGEITKIVINDGVAVWTKDTDFEVLSASPVKVQGEGETTVYIAKDGKIFENEIKIGKEPIKIIG
ncbi:MAG: hypothetical protein IJ408_06645 [Clostridia bacterium]|nr:hypothetical protein [Clostridia bacterium]